MCIIKITSGAMQRNRSIGLKREIHSKDTAEYEKRYWCLINT